MHVTAKLSLIGSIVFALFCAGFAFNGFSSLDEITDPVQLADARGFSLFWAFLTGVGVVFGALSWWIMKGQKDEPEA